MSEALASIEARLEELNLSELATLQEKVAVRLRQRLEQIIVDAAPKPKKRDWPPGFFENIIGSIPEGEIQIDYEGEYEMRDTVK